MDDMTADDIKAAQILAKLSPIACRIFFTGAVNAEYIGVPALVRLLSVSSIAEGKSLFTVNEAGTVVLNRFSPTRVWPVLGPDCILGMHKAEERRLGCDPVKLDTWDFYESYFNAVRHQAGAYCVVPRNPVSAEALAKIVPYSMFTIKDRVKFDMIDRDNASIAEVMADPVVESAVQNGWRKVGKVEAKAFFEFVRTGTPEKYVDFLSKVWDTVAC